MPNGSALIPTFEELMLPLLKRLTDGSEYRLVDLRDAIADEFKLSAEDRAMRLPSQRHFVYNNRLQWAKYYLQSAGLIESMSRGSFRITADGSAVLKMDLTAMNTKLLGQFVKSGTRSLPPAATGAVTPLPQKTPHEELDDAYQKVRAALAVDLIAQVKQCSPAFFEQLVVDLLVAMGYGGNVLDAGQAVGKTGDGGIDGIIKQDPLGLDNVYIQAKRWHNNVGSPEINMFVGSLAALKASKGVLITTAGFTKAALVTAQKNHHIVLVDGKDLAEYMIDFGVGVATTKRYEVRHVDQDYFE